MRAISLLSPHRFTDDDLAGLFRHLGARKLGDIWEIERNHHSIAITIGNADIEEMFTPAELSKMAREFESRVRGRLSVVFSSSPDGFEENMARAVAIALSERWPIMLDDHVGSITRIRSSSHN